MGAKQKLNSASAMGARRKYDSHCLEMQNPPPEKLDLKFVLNQPSDRGLRTTSGLPCPRSYPRAPKIDKPDGFLFQLESQAHPVRPLNPRRNPAPPQ